MNANGQGNDYAQCGGGDRETGDQDLDKIPLVDKMPLVGEDQQEEENKSDEGLELGIDEHKGGAVGNLLMADLRPALLTENQDPDTTDDKYVPSDEAEVQK